MMIDLALSKPSAKFVVYFTETMIPVKYFVYQAAALKLLNKVGAGYSMTDVRTFRDIQRNGPTKMVRNLMTGEMMEIPRGTPHCCDPSTETYWSM